ncbi:MAG: hypothetical protein ACE5IG_05740 [Dehalococcoidia bacterium]
MKYSLILLAGVLGVLLTLVGGFLVLLLVVQSPLGGIRLGMILLIVAVAIGFWGYLWLARRLFSR